MSAPTVALHEASPGRLMNVSQVSLADVMEWEALPEDVRRLAVLIVTRGAVTDTSHADIKTAYRAGFEAGVESCEVTSREDADGSFDDWTARKDRR